MATCNFGGTCFSKYFAINPEDDFEFDLQKEDITGAIASIDGASEDDTQAYQIARVWRQIEHCGIPFELCVEVFLRPGYYEGAYLDGSLYVDGSEYNNIDDVDAADLMEDGLWQTDQACQYKNQGAVTGFARMQGKNLQKKLDAAYSSILNDIEAAVSPLTDHYRCAGIFSNGEAVYEKVA